MNRVKFRFWSEEEKEMKFPNHTNLPNNYSVLMQYTGLIDNNGVEIWEGDILNYKSAKENPHSVVVWNDEKAKFTLKIINVKKDKHGYAGIASAKSNGHTVIGNIYENKELIKE